jgi:hypothetical protein
MSIGIDEFNQLLSGMKKDLLEDLFELISDLKNRINSLDEKIINNERDRRRKNLIIKGFLETEQNENELEERVLEFINSKLQVKVDNRDIDSIFRVGTNNLNNNKRRNIILKLTTEKVKNEIFKSKLKLKGSEIYIDNDYSKEVLQKIYEKRQRKKCQNKKSDIKNGKKVDKKKHHKIAERQKIINKKTPNIVKHKSFPEKNYDQTTPLPSTSKQ